MRGSREGANEQTLLVIGDSVRACESRQAGKGEGRGRAEVKKGKKRDGVEGAWLQ